MDITIQKTALNPTFLSESTQWREKELLDYLLSKGINYSLMPPSDKLKFLQYLIRRCKICPSHFNPVVPDFKLSRYLFIGRNPTSNKKTNYTDILTIDEHKGTVFDKYLLALGLSRSEVCITNLSHCPSVKGAPPTGSTYAFCSPYLSLLTKELIPQLDFIFTLGYDALEAVLGRQAQLLNNYGLLYKGEILGREVTVVPLHHPGYLVLNPIPLSATSDLLKEVRKIVHNPSV